MRNLKLFDWTTTNIGIPSFILTMRNLKVKFISSLLVIASCFILTMGI